MASEQSAQSNAEKKRATAREWYRNNRERVKKKNAERYRANKDAMNARARQYYQDNKQRSAARSRLARYGITDEQYARLYEAQGGRCAICETTADAEKLRTRKSLAVDHCHTTGAIRGLLCGACNKALGLVDDSATIMRSAIAYVESDGLPSTLECRMSIGATAHEQLEFRIGCESTN